MKYSNYKLDDFLKDEFFRTWTINPDDKSDFFWRSFLDNNPDKIAIVKQAKEIILGLKFPELDEPPLSDFEVDAIFDGVLKANRKREGKSLRMIIWSSIRSPVALSRAAVFIFIFSFSVLRCRIYKRSFALYTCRTSWNSMLYLGHYEYEKRTINLFP